MADGVRLHRWDEIALEKVTEVISRKIVTGEREMLSQIYLKRGALVPMHKHESEQLTYVMQGALRFLVGGEEVIVREGEVLRHPLVDRAPGRSARRHADARHLQPDPAGLAERHRRLLSALMTESSSPFSESFGPSHPPGRRDGRRTCGACG